MKKFFKKYLKKTKHLYYLLDLFLRFRFFTNRFDNQSLKFNYKKGKVTEAKKLDQSLVKYIVKNIKPKLSYIPKAQWFDLYKEFHSDIVDELKKEDFEKIEYMLRNPLTNNILMGFDNTAKNLRSIFRMDTFFELDIAADHFISLSNFLEIIKYNNPEFFKYPIKKNINIEYLINQICLEVFPNKLELFPKVFNGEKGIISDFGIAPLRSAYAIYQSIISTNLSNNICEIGAGVGRSAYYSFLLGAKKYTIVDLPISSMVQSYFLLKTLGKSKVNFLEDIKLNDFDGILLLSPDEFFSRSINYDLVINVDSLTELGEETANKYFDYIEINAKKFLSMNHENNNFSVSELIKKRKRFKRVYRIKSWLRNGYIEELYEID